MTMVLWKGTCGSRFKKVNNEEMVQTADQMWKDTGYWCLRHEQVYETGALEMWGVKRAEKVGAGVGSNPTNELCYEEEHVWELQHILRTDDVSTFI